MSLPSFTRVTLTPLSDQALAYRLLAPATWAVQQLAYPATGLPHQQFSPIGVFTAPSASAGGAMLVVEAAHLRHPVRLPLLLRAYVQARRGTLLDGPSADDDTGQVFATFARDTEKGRMLFTVRATLNGKYGFVVAFGIPQHQFEAERNTALVSLADFTATFEAPPPPPDVGHALADQTHFHLPAGWQATPLPSPGNDILGVDYSDQEGGSFVGLLRITTRPAGRNAASVAALRSALQQYESSMGFKALKLLGEQALPEVGGPGAPYRGELEHLTATLDGIGPVFVTRGWLIGVGRGITFCLTGPGAERDPLGYATNDYALEMFLRSLRPRAPVVP